MGIETSFGASGRTRFSAIRERELPEVPTSYHLTRTSFHLPIMTRTPLLLMFVFLCLTHFVVGQGVKISTSPGTPDQSSILDVESTQHGFLPPRMTSEQRDAIVNPSPGLHIYNTTTNCDNFYNGTAWREVCGSCIPPVPALPSSISGNSSPCEGTAGLTYSVTPNSGITYSWSLPPGWLQTSGGNTSNITVTAGASQGMITVVPSNTCGNGPSQSLPVTPVNLPTTSNAGSDQLNVSGTSTSLSANNPTSGSGSWSIIDGIGGTIDNPSSAVSGFTGIAGNSYILRWTVSTSCGTSEDDVTISFATPPLCTPSTVYLFPTDDAHVESGAASSNFGSSTSLHWQYTCCGGPVHSYLKFDLSSLPPGAVVTDSKLWLYYTVTYNNGSSANIHSTSDNWTESTITWNNKPSTTPGAGRAPAAGYLTGPTWASGVVTSTVQAEANGDDTVSFVLTDTEGHGWVVSSHSKEGLNKPYLEITYTCP